MNSINQRGFTLIEIIAVLVIISILSGVAIIKFGSSEESTLIKLSEVRLSQLNNNTAWALIKFAPDEFTDAAVLSTELAANPDLQPSGEGFVLVVKEKAFPVIRTPSTISSPPSWRKGW